MPVVSTGDRDHEPEVRVDHQILCVTIARFDPFRQLDFLLRTEKRETTRLVQKELQSVGRGCREIVVCVGDLLGCIAPTVITDINAAFLDLLKSSSTSAPSSSRLSTSSLSSDSSKQPSSSPSSKKAVISGKPAQPGDGLGLRVRPPALFTIPFCPVAGKANGPTLGRIEKPRKRGVSLWTRFAAASVAAKPKRGVIYGGQASQGQRGEHESEVPQCDVVVVGVGQEVDDDAP